jgi:hypothetical protein
MFGEGVGDGKSALRNLKSAIKAEQDLFLRPDNI